MKPEPIFARAGTSDSSAIQQLWGLSGRPNPPAGDWSHAAPKLQTYDLQLCSFQSSIGFLPPNTFGPWQFSLFVDRPRVYLEFGESKQAAAGPVCLQTINGFHKKALSPYRVNRHRHTAGPCQASPLLCWSASISTLWFNRGMGPKL